MEVELTIELGADDPTLAIPWTDPEGRFEYFDLRRDPAAINRIEEAIAFPGLRDFLNSVNSSPSNLQSAKCDAWFSDEITEEELIFGAKCKFGSYVDLTFHQKAPQASFPLHEAFGNRLMELLKRVPEMPASVEVIIRRAHYEDAADAVREGYYFTLYVFGFGDDEGEARQAWGIALRLVGHAMLQMSAARSTKQ
ncbi:MAG TPA: hypothetical protein VFP40_19420 [Terriglobales bacterium]|nr:hypothetical protein [Terriglobales bacterium]